MAPRILIFSMAMGADYAFELIFNETCAPQFDGHNNSFLASVYCLMYVKMKYLPVVNNCVDRNGDTVLGQNFLRSYIKCHRSQIRHNDLIHARNNEENSRSNRSS